MNWFERHLNWTALGIAIGSVLAFEVLTRISLGFDNIFYDIFFALNSPLIIMLSFVIFTCFTLSLIGYGWVLHQKKLSPWLLLFYFIVAVLCLIYFIYQAMSWPYNPWGGPHPPDFGWSIPLVFVLGWIVALSLKNRNHSSETGLLHKIYTSGPRLKFTVFSIVGISLIVSVISFFFINYGYIHYNSSENQTYNIPEISFEYPAHYSKLSKLYSEFPVLTNGYDLEPKTLYLDSRLMYDDSSWITIEYHDEEKTKNIHKIFPTLKKRVVTFGMRMSFGVDEDIVDTPANVGDIPARRLFISAENPPPVTSDNCSTEARYRICTKVYFENNGCLWIISWQTWDEATDHTPPYFDHLLETFKIHN